MNIKDLEIKLSARIKPGKDKLLAHIKSPFFRDTVTQLLLIPSVALFLASWILAIYYFPPTEYLVPLKYNSFLGVVSLGHWYDLYLLPAMVLICSLANLFLGKVLYEKDKFLSYILAASNIFLAIVAITIIINFGKLLAN